MTKISKLITLLRLVIFFLLSFLGTEMVVAKTESAIFAGGCFWCMESDFDKLPGVVESISGYDGGQLKNPDYKRVSSGKTRYAEVVKITYDPTVVEYKRLLEYFWKHIDPTVKDAQFCDHGPQYRSAIFFLNETQKIQALASLEKVEKLFPKIYTQVTPSTGFYVAEDYHQNYYKKNPLRYRYYRRSCNRDNRIEAIWHDKTW